MSQCMFSLNSATFAFVLLFVYFPDEAKDNIIIKMKRKKRKKNGRNFGGKEFFLSHEHFNDARSKTVRFNSCMVIISFFLYFLRYA